MEDDDGGLFEREANELVSEGAVQRPPSTFGRPYPDQTPHQIISRWYEFALYTVGSTGQSSLFDPIGILVTNQELYQAMQTFVYARFDMQVKIVSDAVPNVYGAMVIGPVSNYPYTVTPSWLLSHDSCVLDYSTQNEVIITIPWNSPCEYVSLYKMGKLSSFTGTVLDSMFMMKWSDLFGINTVDSNVSAFTFRVYARFVNVVTQGVMFQNSLPIAAERFQAQSRSAKSNSLDRGGAFDKILYAAANQVGGKIVDKASRWAMNGGLEKTWEAASMWASSWLESEEPTTATVASAPLESEPKTEEVNPTQVPLKQTQWGDLVATVPVVSPLTTLGVSKTSDIRVSDICRKPSCISYGEVPQPYGTLLDLTWVHPYPIHSSSSEQTFAPEFGRLAWFSQFYRFWRGGISFSLMLTTSPFVSAKVRVFLVWQDPMVQKSVGSQIVKEISVRGTTVVDFTVPYLWDMQWQQTTLFWPVTDPGYWAQRIPRLVIDLATPLTYMGSSTPKVFYTLWKYAAPDFEFCSVRNPEPQTTEAGIEKYQAQMFVSRLGSQNEMMFDSALDLSVSFKREGETVESICRRWHSIDEASVSAFTELQTESNAGGTPRMSLLSAMSQLFYWRVGDIDYKVNLVAPSPTDDSPMVCAYLDTYVPESVAMTVANPTPLYQYALSLGSQRLDMKFADILEFNAPCVSQVPFVYSNVDFYQSGLEVTTTNAMAPRPVYLAGNGTTTPAINELVQRAGRGFHFIYDVPPPVSGSQWYWRSRYSNSLIVREPQAKKRLKSAKVLPGDASRGLRNSCSETPSQRKTSTALGRGKVLR